MDEDFLLSISEAARLLGVSTQTLKAWDKNGRFKAIRNPINNYRMYKLKKVERLLKFIKSGKKENKLI